ncbi:MAG: primosomal protein N', partial [Thermoleophilaceae bacterium]|nr:primosomal protein N' [Thermoleophilaceae bacterium]
VAAEGARLTTLQRAILEQLAAIEDGCTLGALAATVGSDASAVRRLEGRGLVTIEQRQQRRAPTHLAVGAEATHNHLTPDQDAALAAIRTAMQNGHNEYLLHGVTGSGKTEIYLGATETALAAGRGVIVMVPEIALTPQTITRFAARFGDRVAVLHSKLTAGQRRDEWMRLRSGEATVCVGPRSAVFAPVRNLGLLIIDEEHDSSYKQESDPRYDAREVAAHRAAAAGAVLVAGSATPRPESWHRMQRLSLPKRVDNSPLPSVEMVDMRGVRSALHPITGAALASVARAGEKAIILLNRRGWSNFLTCTDCGHVWCCPDCDVTLVLHMAQRTIRCHHCGYNERQPEVCAECGSTALTRHGAGTERLASELQETFAEYPDFEIVRLDADSAAKQGVATLLRRYEHAKSGVLVGTQMVAKGHDFPDVTLAVVIDADATLRFPDFRAEERTFALVAQLAGRSGRGKHGHVLVQTQATTARSLEFAAHHDAEGFLKDELQRREAFLYPPFASMIRVVCASEELAVAQACIDFIATNIPDGAGQQLGPIPLFRLKGRERFQLELKAVDREPAVAAVREAVELASASKVSNGVIFTVDVDPQ